MPFEAGAAGAEGPKFIYDRHLHTHISSNRTDQAVDRAPKGGYNVGMSTENYSRDDLISLLSDLQKEAWGFRPREFDFMSTAQIGRDVEYFTNLLKEQAEEAKEAADPNAWKKYVSDSEFTNTISFS